MLKHVVIGLGLSLSLTACIPDKFSTEPDVKGLEGSAPLQTLFKPELNSSVTMRTGNEFKVVVDANPTTGYMWYLDPGMDESVVALVSNDYIGNPNPGQMVGVGGRAELLFTAVGVGETKVTLRYSRGPDGEAGDMKFIAVDVTE